MSTTVSTGPDGSPTMTELVSGIMGDVQNLAIQHLDLFRREINDDVRKSTDAVSSLAVGLAVAQVGGFLLSLMLVHLMMELAPKFPTWACYGIMGFAVSAIGACGIFVGVKKLKSIDGHQTAKVMKDDAKWLTNSK